MKLLNKTICLISSLSFSLFFPLYILFPLRYTFNFAFFLLYLIKSQFVSDSDNVPIVSGEKFVFKLLYKSMFIKMF